MKVSYIRGDMEFVNPSAKYFQKQWPTILFIHFYQYFPKIRTKVSLNSKFLKKCFIKIYSK